MTSVRAQKDLILLYEEENFVRPTETIAWLNAREWVSAHHHVSFITDVEYFHQKQCWKYFVSVCSIFAFCFATHCVGSIMASSFVFMCFCLGCFGFFFLILVKLRKEGDIKAKSAKA